MSIPPDSRPKDGLPVDTGSTFSGRDPISNTANNFIQQALRAVTARRSPMGARFRSKLLRLISPLIIISLCASLLPPPRHTHALSPSLPDYTAQLLSVSGTLERDGRGGLRFP